MSFRESVSNFFRYVAFFAFVIAVVAGGMFYWKRFNPSSAQKAPAETVETVETPPPAPIASVVPLSLPSAKLGPVMQVNLPALLGPIDEKPYELGKEFTAFETEVRQANRPEKMRPAWNTAGAVCREIRALAVERNAVVAALEKKPVTLPNAAAPHSKADRNDLEAKHQFFQSSARQRWATGTPMRKKKIEVLYRRLLAEESAAR